MERFEPGVAVTEAVTARSPQANMERRDCDRVRSETGRQGGSTAVSRPVLGWDWARPWHWDHPGEP